jgi:hypothetical protein
MNEGQDHIPTTDAPASPTVPPDVDATADDALTDLREQLAAAQSQLTRTQQQLEATMRGRHLDAALIEAGAIDLETARLVAEPMLTGDTTAAAVARDMRRDKPFLFRRATPPSAPSTVTGAMGARTDPALQEMAVAEEAARSSGRRDDLLRYLRVRRNGSARAAG